MPLNALVDSFCHDQKKCGTEKVEVYDDNNDDDSNNNKIHNQLPTVWLIMHVLSVCLCV